MSESEEVLIEVPKLIAEVKRRLTPGGYNPPTLLELAGRAADLLEIQQKRIQELEQRLDQSHPRYVAEDLAEVVRSLREQLAARDAVIAKAHAVIHGGSPAEAAQILADAAPESVLAEHDAQVLDEAADEYRSGQVTGIFMGRDDYSKAWLRERAANCRNGAEMTPTEPELFPGTSAALDRLTLRGEDPLTGHE